MFNAFLYRMPSGIPGDISRRQDSTVESQLLDAKVPFAAYGLFGKLDNGNFVPLGGRDGLESIYGLLVRAYPTQGAQEPLGDAMPPVSGIANVLRRGYMTVKNHAGVPVNGGAVYVRMAEATADKPLGGIEAVADGSNTMEIAHCLFTNAGDANSNVEIAFNI